MSESEETVRISRIVTMTWKEPTEGISAEVWCLTEDEWANVSNIQTWAILQMGDAVDDTIPEVIVHGTDASGGDVTGLYDALCILSDNLRYQEPGLYQQDCKEFEAYGIKRGVA